MFSPSIMLSSVSYRLLLASVNAPPPTHTHTSSTLHLPAQRKTRYNKGILMDNLMDYPAHLIFITHEFSIKRPAESVGASALAAAPDSRTQGQREGGSSTSPPALCYLEDTATATWELARRPGRSQNVCSVHLRGHFPFHFNS